MLQSKGWRETARYVVAPAKINTHSAIAFTAAHEGGAGSFVSLKEVDWRATPSSDTKEPAPASA